MTYFIQLNKINKNQVILYNECLVRVRACCLGKVGSNDCIFVCSLRVSSRVVLSFWLGSGGFALFCLPLQPSSFHCLWTTQDLLLIFRSYTRTQKSLFCCVLISQVLAWKTHLFIAGINFRGICIFGYWPLMSFLNFSCITIQGY